MPYVPGKRLYHCSELSDWTKQDHADSEADKAYEFLQEPLMNRVFHEWRERKMMTTWRKEYWRGTKERYGEKCACCGTKTNLCLDHKTPVSKGGFTCGENLQFLCKSCNSKKHDKLYYEWLKEIGRF